VDGGGKEEGSDNITTEEDTVTKLRSPGLSLWTFTESTFERRLNRRYGVALGSLHWVIFHFDKY
jgi:hypothetical protein